MDLCCKSSGFADFENTTDRGSAVMFEADSGLCLSHVRTLGPKRNLDHKSFFSLDRHVNEFIQLILFSKEIHFMSGVRLSLELYCAVVIKHVAFFTILAKLTVVFTCASLPVNFTPLFSGVVVVSDLNKNFGGSTDLAKKRYRSADLHTPIHPPR